MITFNEHDIQELSEKYFGDCLTQKELEKFREICTPTVAWVEVDDSEQDGVLGKLVGVVTTIILLARGDRRRELPEITNTK